MNTFRLPDLGEGLEEAEIVAWHVNVGDHIVADQPLVSVQTDKAVVEVPSPRGGRIARLNGAEGDMLKVGAPLVEFATEEGEDTGTVVGALEREDDGRKSIPLATHELPAEVRASPAVRTLAKKLNVDLDLLAATGPNGSLTRADIERAAREGADLGKAEPLRGMRRSMAQRMTQAHREVVPAGVVDEADIGDWATAEDISVRLIRGISRACKAQPSLNAHFIADTGVRHVIERIDIAIAVDTEDGLIAPVMRNVGEQDAPGLRVGLDRLRADAANRVVPPEELRGATITLSNFGMFGGRFAHLVIVPPQVAIIGAGRAADRVVAHRGSPAVRRTLPLTVIFDHRVVTGGEGTRFLAALKADLECPR